MSEVKLVSLTGLVSQVSKRNEFTKSKGRDAGKQGSAQNILITVEGKVSKVVIWDRTDMSFLSGQTYTFTNLKPQTDGSYWSSYKTEFDEIIDSHKLYADPDESSVKAVELANKITPPIKDNITPKATEYPVKIYRVKVTRAKNFQSVTFGVEFSGTLDEAKREFDILKEEALKGLRKIL